MQEQRQVQRLYIGPINLCACISSARALQANGVCTTPVAQYAHDCRVLESTINASRSGVCDTDVNECLSGPCMHKAACTDSSASTAAVAVNTYKCACAAGFAGGMCAYKYAFAYAAQCVMTSVTGGNCGVDVDECASKPCKNDGVCH
jgi:hypothetical protein